MSYIGTETLDSAIDLAKILGKKVWDPSEETKQNISGGLQTTGQVLGGAWMETREFGEWYDVKQNLGAVGARGIEATGAVISNVVGKPVAGFARDKLNLDPRIAGAVALAAEMAATAGTAKVGQIAKARVGQYVDDAYGLFSATGMGTGAHGAGKVTQINWREGIKKIPKGRELLDDAADYAIPDQIQSINKLKGSVKAQERAKLAQLRKDGIIKPAPDYTLKSSAEATKYYGLDTKQLKKYNLKYDQTGSSLNPDFQLGLMEPRAMDTLKRVLSEEMLTPNKAIFKAGKDKWKRINDILGQEAHHIIPLHVSAKVMLDFLYDKFGNIRLGGMDKWKARVAADAKKGIFHGNDRRNIVAARGSKKVPLTEAGQRGEIYHRQGLPDMDNPGYHTLEKLISGIGLDEAGVPLYYQLRDLMSGQQKLKNQADKFWYEIIEKPRPGPRHTFKDGLLVPKKK